VFLTAFSSSKAFQFSSRELSASRFLCRDSRGRTRMGKFHRRGEILVRSTRGDYKIDARSLNCRKWIFQVNAREGKFLELWISESSLRVCASNKIAYPKIRAIPENLDVNVILLAQRAAVLFCTRTYPPRSQVAFSIL